MKTAEFFLRHLLGSGFARTVGAASLSTFNCLA
jgi:hypothetical protein